MQPVLDAVAFERAQQRPAVRQVQHFPRGIGLDLKGLRSVGFGADERHALKTAFPADVSERRAVVKAGIAEVDQPRQLGARRIQRSRPPEQVHDRPRVFRLTFTRDAAGRQADRWAKLLDGRQAPIHRCQIPVNNPIPKDFAEIGLGIRAETHNFGKTIACCFWYLPFLSAYEISHSSSPVKNSTWAMPSLA